MAKDTLYIEADDEITVVIDRVVTAKNKVVALVLPKRATVFHSAVNMKLLKKAAQDAKKSLVVISSEESIKSIAAVSGIHVAKSLSSKPEIPKKPKSSKSETVIDADEIGDTGSEADAVVPAVAGKGKDETQKSSSDDSDDDTIKMESDGSDEDDSEPAEDKEDDKKSRKSKLKIPDFNSFRIKASLFVLAIFALIGGWVFGFIILPEATITIDTDTSRIDVSTDFVAQTNLELTNTEENRLSAKKVTTEKTDSVTVPATGEKDVGEKATGTVSLTNCNVNGTTVPAGTSFSAGGLNYVTIASVDLGPAIIISGQCRSDDFPDLVGSVKDVGVEAAAPGEQYNAGAQSFSSSISKVTAFGSAMAGGTSKIAKVVSSEDIKNAEDQLAGSSKVAAVGELKELLNAQQLFSLEDSLEESNPQVKRSAKADAEVEDMTVTKTVTYSLVGVSADDVSDLLQAGAAESLQDKDQNIRSNGLDQAAYTLIQKISDTEYKISVRTVATIGPELDEATLKNEIIGKERGDIENLIEAKDGVRSVTVEFSPFWVFQTPDKPEKITIVINEET